MHLPRNGTIGFDPQACTIKQMEVLIKACLQSNSENVPTRKSVPGQPLIGWGPVDLVQSGTPDAHGSPDLSDIQIERLPRIYTLWVCDTCFLGDSQKWWCSSWFPRCPQKRRSLLFLPSTVRATRGARRGRAEDCRQQARRERALCGSSVGGVDDAT